MKIIAGTFGLKGSAFIGGGRLHIESSKKASYTPEQIQSVEVDQLNEKRFSLGSALIGALLLGLILTAFLGGVGLVAGLLIGALGGFVSEKHNAAEVAFVDGNKVRLLCTGRAVNKLIRLKG